MNITERQSLLSTLSATQSKILADYQLAYLSRRISLTGRREVLNGRAKFGAFGAGKELAQLAMARVFQKGDFRSGYYRDQTFALATGLASIQQIYAQLYGSTDLNADPAHGGRNMPAHYASRLLDENGKWQTQTDQYNSASDLAPTSGQMPRLVGLAYASRVYRGLEALQHLTQFSHNGNEVAFGTIGNGSTAEGTFWEAINAMGVLQVPVVMSIFDDGYAISVPNEHQFIHADLSQQLAGFGYDEATGRGYKLYRVPGWDYAGLLEAYREAAELAREKHIPAIIHVVEMTQPQGHSTSGSHERYKSAERMQFETDFDPIPIMRKWMLENGHATVDQLDDIEAETHATVEYERLHAWQSYEAMHDAESAELITKLEALQPSAEIAELLHKLYKAKHVRRRQRLEIAQQALLLTRHQPSPAHEQLRLWIRAYNAQHIDTYGSHLYSQNVSPLNVPAIAPRYSQSSQKLPGFEVLRANFDALLNKDPRICIFGEDVGLLGDVNQGLAGMQAKYGDLRVSDTGIRETTIIGQATGMALRGLRPIAEIQYLDYIFYATPALTDDLASTHWRTVGGQAAPVIVRTRGHRLEGIWHAGSHLGALTHLLRGMHICVPRNMVQAAGFYNTLLQGDDPALVIESLNGYRLHETLPDNIGEFTIPLGIPDVLRVGDDVTIVTYGSMCRIAMVAAERLQGLGISAEIIDVQTLLPFDINHTIAQSVAKSSRLIVLDEDVPGGASAYILQQILEEQGAYWSLDSEPRTITSQAHRPAYSTDGDYFSKPNAETITVAVYELMQESDPSRFPEIF